MFHLVLEYEFDFLANSFVVPSVLVWGFDSSRKQCSYLWKVWFLPVLNSSSLLRGFWQALQVVALLSDGLVLFCWGDSFEEDLCWGPRLGAFVDLVEFDDGVTSCCVALFKTVEALSRGAFFFSHQCGAKNKGRCGRGSWPWNYRLKHVLALDIYS